MKNAIKYHIIQAQSVHCKKKTKMPKYIQSCTILSPGFFCSFSHPLTVPAAGSLLHQKNNYEAFHFQQLFRVHAEDTPVLFLWPISYSNYCLRSRPIWQ